ncbi:Clan MH, family M18, aspartyl aminopeptidase-like metallopeptidase [Trichomonas vaginalis G3]|uniref:aspartyl aminopeptidase n=1 Tax=Trichomonas vaginalis (strain ATCC PRA-98 / G3) TaxID=412133 RepID=A2F7I4_TRIV3|nr:aminopeptidase protein [Trichomonas vaginalis G3]EAX99142.1 Clan MH, family M18, aspartyl aminopeptidase-like metallopeptidase [Trichomonas vaginalis G3]KAI5549186.1 aminopeptidase protein [Trichomonas vaginalis G3]|eukprot:XP_001312072.1 Clan MH, family M18, aspartyl aminopeptidase-like metallopeptidase [Trichomonas vaginalis G3]
MLSKEKFVELLDKIKSPFHFVELARELLKSKGFVELDISKNWENIPEKFFVVREERELIAGLLSSKDTGIFIGGHIDYPGFRIKPNTEEVKDNLEICQTMKYGDPLDHTWFDHDLGIAGIVSYKNNDKIEQKLIKTGAVAIIPNISCYLQKSRTANLPPIVPIFGSADGSSKLQDIIAKEVGCKPEEIVSYDLRFYDVNPTLFPTFDGDLIGGQGLDDLCCSIPLLDAFVNYAQPREKSCFVCFYDNEEIGSVTPFGARSDFITSIIGRLGLSPTFYANSYFVSTDVVHGHHYQYKDMTVPGAECILGEGIGFMWSPQDATAANPELFALVDSIAKKNNVVIAKYFHPHGGYTISRHIAPSLGIKAIDIGVPLLAMHSIREYGAFVDIQSFHRLVISSYASL